MAGKRAGLDGARSGLWFEFRRIVSELRPRYVLVENVPGLLSSCDGRDFGTVITGLGELGYAVSWAVLDSQHFGVPQRRRRVFIVAGPDPESTEQILSIREGCGGHPAPRRTAGEDVAGEVGDGSAESLRARANDSHREDTSTYIPEVVPNAISAKWAKGSGGPAGDEIQNLIAIRTAQTSANGHGLAEDVAHTIDGANGQAVAMRMGGDYDDPYLTLDDKAFLAANPMSDRQMSVYDGGTAVRRLTPVECARLQGFPEVTKYLTIQVCKSDAESAPKRSRRGSASSKHARFDVRMSCADGEVEIRNPDGSLLFASNAGGRSKSRLSIAPADSARLAALMTSTLDRITLGGGVALPIPSERFSDQPNGSNTVSLSTAEIAALAEDAPSVIKMMSQHFTSTTSEAGSSFPNSDSAWRTLCCCVARVIAGCIPEQIKTASSYDFDLAIFETWLDGADGPQYRALGNAVTVPVIQYLGERVIAIEKGQGEML